MIQKYNNQSLAFGITGLVLQFASPLVDRGPRGEPGPLSLVMLFLGVALLIWGLALYAKAKGRSPLWGLFGLGSIFGLIVLAVLKDMSEPDAPERPFTARELDDLFGPPPAPKARKPVGQLVGNSCSVCGNRIASALNADFCPACGQAVHETCKQAGSTATGACPVCGGVKGAAPVEYAEEPKPERVRAPKRPLGVTIIGSLLIIAGGINLFALAAANDPAMRSAAADANRSYGSVVAQVLVGAGVLIFCGVGMLCRRNWARVVYVLVGAVGAIAILLGKSNPTYQVVSIGFFFLFTIILFSTSSNAYFHGKRPAM